MLQKLQATHARHHHVEQDEAGPLETLELLERLVTVPGGRHPGATVIQDLRERLADVRVIIDDEDARGRVYGAPRYASPIASRSDGSCGCEAQPRTTCGLRWWKLWEAGRCAFVLVDRRRFDEPQATSPSCRATSVTITPALGNSSAELFMAHADLVTPVLTLLPLSPRPAPAPP